MKTSLIILLFMPIFSFAQEHTFLGIDQARKELKNALINKIDDRKALKNLIDSKGIAIAIAEPVLFKIYGKEQIISERPYEAYLINGFWVINGTLSNRTLGGGFIIIISSNDGQIIRLTHYK